MSSAPARSRILLVSCYESGHQPLAVASASAYLERAGHRATTYDLAIAPLDGLERVPGIEQMRLVAISAPMHTALRIGLRAARRIRRIAPEAHVCVYGLYGALNANYLLAGPVDSVVGGEFEQSLLDLADALRDRRELESVQGLRLRDRPAPPPLRRLPFAVPDRDSLPGLDRYAKLEIGGSTRQAAAIEASRGCLHFCRHCPIPPVYGGRFFVVPRDVVLEDVRRLASRGVAHLTFADPDFFNGPGHSMALARAIHAEFPDVTFDITTKIENILKHREKLDELATCGLLFVVSAVESLSDVVLDHLRKGHQRSDVAAAVRLLRGSGIEMRPSLVAFTPWTRMEDYLEVLEWVERDDLIDQVDAVQFSIRLLVPPGSLLADSDAMRPHLRGLVPDAFAYAWEHPDPRMDRLHRTISKIVGQAALDGTEARRAFSRVRDAAFAASGQAPPPLRPIPSSLAVSPPPRLTEPWFC
jgi:radical SAM superfamily enzyme YgiQ (UPF0313 family)